MLLARTGTMDVTAVPEVVDEGPAWLVIDAHRSSGQWAITMATTAAIAKARDHAIAIAFVRDFNDAGAFGTYVRMAAREGMMAMATNNSLPLVSPWGAMENVLSGAPFAAASPGGEHAPITSATSRPSRSTTATSARRTSRAGGCRGRSWWTPRRAS